MITNNTNNTATLQQIIDERISFLKEQINPCNKPEENKTFQLQIDAIRSAAADDIEEVEAIIAEKKTLLRIVTVSMNSIGYLQSWRV